MLSEAEVAKGWVNVCARGSGGSWRVKSDARFVAQRPIARAHKNPNKQETNWVSHYGFYLLMTDFCFLMMRQKCETLTTFTLHHWGQTQQGVLSFCLRTIKNPKSNPQHLIFLWADDINSTASANQCTQTTSCSDSSLSVSSTCPLLLRPNCLQPRQCVFKGGNTHGAKSTHSYEFILIQSFATPVDGWWLLISILGRLQCTQAHIRFLWSEPQSRTEIWKRGNSKWCIKKNGIPVLTSLVWCNRWAHTGFLHARKLKGPLILM